MGPVEKIVAKTATAAHDIEVEDIALALLTFKNGALGVLQGSTAVYPGLPERLEITGTGGTAVVAAGQVKVWEFKDEKGEAGAYGSKVKGELSAEPAAAAAADPAALQVASHRAQFVDLIEAIAQGREPAIPGEEARKPLEIILAVYESARTGQEITLPLAVGAR